MSATTTSPLDLVMSMGKKSTAKPKAAKPTVAVDASMAKMLDEYFENERLAKSHKAMAETARDQIVAQAKPYFYDACKNAGKALSSVSLGKGTLTVTNNYSLIDADEGDALSHAFGEQFPMFFRRSIEMSVSKDVSNDDDFIKDLVQRVGTDFFQKYFVVKMGLKVTDAMHAALSLDEGVREIAQPFIDGQVIKPYSPSIKLA